LGVWMGAELTVTLGKQAYNHAEKKSVQRR